MRRNTFSRTSVRRTATAPAAVTRLFDDVGPAPKSAPLLRALVLAGAVACGVAQTATVHAQQAPRLQAPATTATLAKPLPVAAARLRKFSALPRRESLPFLTPPTAQRLPTSGGSGGTRISRTPVRREKNAQPAVDVRDDAGLGRYCTQRVVSEANGEYTKIVLGNQSDKIYPGAIYTDSSIIDGSYTGPSQLQRKPYRLATLLFSGASTGASHVEVQPTLGAVNDGITTLMRRSSNVVNASSVALDVTQVHSLEQLAFKLQAGYQGYGVDLAAEFEQSKENRKRVIFAKLTQVYFSVVVDGASPATLVNDARSAIPATAVYVHKVNYGRIGILKIETDYSEEEIKAALSFRYSGGGQGASASANLQHKKVLDDSKISGFFMGGDATNGIVSLAGAQQLDEFNAYVRGGLRLNTMVAPTPISYELKYLDDGATAAVNSTTTYTERHCESARGVTVRLDGISIQNVHKAVDGSDCPTERCSSDCGYAWGSIHVQVEERKNGVTVQAVTPTASGAAVRNTVIWQREQNAPQRGITNYKAIANNTASPLDHIGTQWTYVLDPRVYAAGGYYLKVTSEIKTNHKDNHLAGLGFHGMKRAVVRDVPLKSVIYDSANTAHKYGSFVAGPFSSESNRLHHFRAHFTVKPE